MEHAYAVLENEIKSSAHCVIGSSDRLTAYTRGTLEKGRINDHFPLISLIDRNGRLSRGLNYSPLAHDT